ncbi:hypothetical protein KP509_05G069700 [Ceratopteris richardii]|uniref:C2 NT-type domain-containing protein n=1 Tax=Ceratopteris richardii TaxID=49495 RepID=A0A8T2UU24_CERRI|nr:hypothetical protein KP509_05G069700 [Ceratopteris richardii]
MFRTTRKKNARTKEKITFKLEFHLTNVPQQKWDKLVVSLVYLETGKVTSKTGKSPVKNGICHWPDTLLESLYISADDDGNDAPTELYKLVVSTGSSRFGVLGDTNFNLGDYVNLTAPVSVSLPLQNCSFGSILQVKVQRMQPRSTSRETESQKELLHQSSTVSTSEGDQCLEGESIRLGDDGCEENPFKVETVESVVSSPARWGVSSLDNPSTLEGDTHVIIREDDEFVSMTSLASDSSRHEAKTCVYDGEIISAETYKTTLSSSHSFPSYPERSSDSLSRFNACGNPPLPGSTGVGHEDKSRWETSQRTRLQRTASVIMPSSLVHDANDFAVAEIEDLRQQLENEAKRSEEMQKKLSVLIAERDSIKQEMENLRVSGAPPLSIDREGSFKCKPQTEASLLDLKELQDELDYVKGLNLNLSVQLEKTQESNSQLLLEIQDLERDLEMQRSQTGPKSEKLEDKQVDMCELVESLKKQLAVLERDTQKLTEENLEYMSQLKDANDNLQQKDELIARLEVEKIHGHGSNNAAERIADILDEDLKERLRKSEEDRLAIEVQCQTFLRTITQTENDYTVALEKINDLEVAYQVLKQEMNEAIQELKNQLEDSKNQLSVMSNLHNDKIQVIEDKEKEIAELQAEMSSILRAKKDEEANVHQLQITNRMLEDKLREEQVNAPRIMNQLEVAKTNSFQLERELEGSQVKVKDLLQIVSELELSNKGLHDELHSVLVKDGQNKSQIQDYELRISMLEDEIKSLRTMNASLESEMEEVKSLKDGLQSMKQSKSSTEDSANSVQDANVKVVRRPLEEINAEVNETQQKQNSHLAWKLSEKEVELQDLKMRVFYLEEDLERKVSALDLAERKLKEQRDSVMYDGGNQVSYLTRSLSRTNSRAGANKPSIPPSREAKELSDLRSKVKLLEAEVVRKAAEFEESKEQWKEQYAQLSSHIEHLELANKELEKDHSDSSLEQALNENQNAMLCQRENELLSKLASQEAMQHEIEALREEKKELERAISKCSAAAKGDNILKRVSTLETELAEVLESNVMYKTQLQSVFAMQQNVQAAALENIGSIDKVIKDLAELKRKNTLLEDELCDMKERYFNMSLQFAEVEAEREELVMTIRSLRAAKKFLPLVKAIF